MPENPIIVFVCQHGAAKSILAAAYFNRLAEELGLDTKAVARGTNPDKEIAESTLARLSKDGLTPTESKPQKISLADIRSAKYLISLCELPAEYAGETVVEQWDGIPAVSENYDQARDAILDRINLLINRIRRLS